jgi:hypothetical protein
MTTASSKVFVPGHYALYHTIEQKTHHFKVDMPTDGRWAGYTFLSSVTGDKHTPIKGQLKAQILSAIKRNPIEAAALYGRTTGVCGICHRTLTVQESVDRGIGPICYEKLCG